ncbi:hypothetical protein BDV34DRAFT_24368 [Aspergillus parasiticus]|uniref:Secreted protein n=2 Tax=Aspergillus subgen. Circumdati TaxID=2720871 RepID=A0A5N6DVT6_ASPPA|nr:hypothetical protein BDV34DRAFT_24368 [Aspergillus parasiticus]KAE8307775.1 hypothetical protein BDV41DRAFT_30786 [Aspergillus transmontanensis]
MNVIILIFLSLTALNRDSWDRQTHVGGPCGASPNSLATRRSAISSFPARCWLPVHHGKNSSEFEFHGYHSVESGARCPTPTRSQRRSSLPHWGYPSHSPLCCNIPGADRGIVP